jgi:hypothetical protein
MPKRLKLSELNSEFKQSRGRNPVKEDEMGRASSMNGREEEYIQDFGGKARRKEATRKTKT